MNAIERLQQAIYDLHGLEAEYVRAEPVHEIFQGKTVWEGDVKVFRVHGHPQAQFAYAWTREDDDGTKHHVAVLGVPPINSTLDAVRAAVIAHMKKQKEGELAKRLSNADVQRTIEAEFAPHKCQVTIDNAGDRLTFYVYDEPGKKRSPKCEATGDAFRSPARLAQIIAGFRRRL